MEVAIYPKWPPVSFAIKFRRRRLFCLTTTRLPALSEISRGFKTSGTITILNFNQNKSTEFNELLMEIHRLRLQTCIFDQTKNFFNFIKSNLAGSLEVTALVFHNPESFIPKASSQLIASPFKVIENRFREMLKQSSIRSEIERRESPVACPRQLCLCLSPQLISRFITGTSPIA